MPRNTRSKTSKRPKRRLVIHHRHTGRIVPRHHTSYSLLIFLMLLVGIFLAGITFSVRADYINVTASVLGEPPPEAAFITEPVDGQRFSEIPIDVKGTCPVGDNNYYVRIYRNDVFSGSVLCSAEGTFALQSDLFEGENILKARIFNGANVEGPTSPSVTVYYDPPPPPVTPTKPGEPKPKPKPPKVSQLIIKSENFYRGYLPGERVIWPVEIAGGTAPYALSVDWGDGNNNLISRSKAGHFELSHIYNHPGVYQGSYNIIIKVSDSAGQQAYLQLVVIVNDPKVIAPTEDTAAKETLQTLSRLLSMLFFSWPIYLLALLMIISFWLGERRELFLLRRKRRLRSA